ncbi:transcription factor grauzone-like [Culicoides brevitarsis]|uniref:transcription factor grauzone-like n=1 Tax=Culicoides brevitarsis TaxID=469753 RepID=UPI00307C663C
MKIAQNVCRLCTKLLSDDNFKLIDDVIRVKIQEILRIETLLEDKFNRICVPCYTKVDSFHRFFEEIHTAQSFFEEKPSLSPDIKIEEGVEDGIAKVFIKPVEESIESDESEEEKIVKKRKSLSEEDLQGRMINEFFDFRCQKCGNHLKTWKKYRKHMQRRHSERRPSISCCQTDVEVSHIALLSHFYSHTDPEKLRCDACGRHYSSLRSLTQHFRKVHAVNREKKDEPKVFCPECGMLLVKRCLQSHMKTHQPRIKLQCDLCKKFLQSRKAMIYHMTQQHLPKNPEKDQILCSICAKSFASMDRFNHHLRYHHDNTTGKCPDCHIVMRLENLRVHRKRVHEIKKVSCPICFKEFKNNDRLRGHKIKVHVEPKFECDICQKKYKTKDKMQEHRSTHFNELRFKCDLCDHMNNDYGNMTKHRKTKHRDAPYPAPGTARKVFEIARH